MKDSRESADLGPELPVFVLDLVDLLTGLFKLLLLTETAGESTLAVLEEPPLITSFVGVLDLFLDEGELGKYLRFGSAVKVVLVFNAGLFRLGSLLGALLSRLVVAGRQCITELGSGLVDGDAVLPTDSRGEFGDLGHRLEESRVR